MGLKGPAHLKMGGPFSWALLVRGQTEPQKRTPHGALFSSPRRQDQT